MPFLPYYSICTGRPRTDISRCVTTWPWDDSHLMGKIIDQAECVPAGLITWTAERLLTCSLAKPNR